MKRSIRVIMTLVMAMTSLSAASAEEIKIGGGGTPMDAIFKPIEEHFEKASGIALTMNFSNASIAFKQMANGDLDASAAGLGFEDMLATLKKDGAEVKDPAAFVPTTIGKGNIYVIVHKDNPVAKLSKEQLTGIFSGKISNWKEVGGNDAPIIVVLSNINPATNGAFNKLAMDNAPYVKEVLDAGRFEDLRDKVAANVEAIGFGPATMLNNSVKTPEIPELARPVILITKGKPAAKVQKLIDYVVGEGKKFTKL